MRLTRKQLWETAVNLSLIAGMILLVGLYVAKGAEGRLSGDISTAPSTTSLTLTDYERGELDSYKARSAVMESQKTALIAKMNELAQEGKQLEGSFRTAHSLAPECTFDQAGAKFTCPPPVAPTPKKGK